VYEKEAEPHRGMGDQMPSGSSGEAICSSEGKVTIMRPRGYMGGSGIMKRGCIGVSRLNQCEKERTRVVQGSPSGKRVSRNCSKEGGGGGKTFQSSDITCT
jgi:hypothetical protein